MRIILLAYMTALVLGAQQPIFFLQMSDPQFGMYTRDQSFEQETANFEFAIATANRLKPAFVVICGDLINKPGDETQAAEYLRIAGKLDQSIPLYPVAGNHDVRNEPTPESLAWYRKRFGRDYYTFRSGNLAAFVLNSSLIHSPQHAMADLEAQEQWLRGALEQSRQAGVRHRVVFQHHPFFLEKPDEPDQYFNIPLERRRRYLDLLVEYGVTHVFAGHYHRNAFGRSGALEMVTTGPVGMPQGKEDSGMRVVMVRESGIEHQYHQLGRLPQRVELGTKPGAPKP
ncbi:MAG: metallophosphoesterase [Bryobacteraceae bacterium]